MAAEAQKQQDSDVSAESIPFSAEISKVLKLMIHSLYTNKDIFLRELISNASDACDKLRYESQQDESLLGDQSELEITLSYDEKAKTLNITDTGIGMNREDLIANLGTIAKSGTEEFFKQMTGDQAKDTNLIGQFGVGFYSGFMVASQIDVISRKAGEAEAWSWSSNGDGAFTVEPADEHPRGTSITLHLKEDAKDYLDKFRLKHVVQTYSDHIAFPIKMVDEENNIETINSASAIWTRSKPDISDEQYLEFYRHIAHSPDEPFITMHNKAEGVIEYTNLLYVPSKKPFDLFNPDRTCRVKLYVKRVFIADEGIELVPAYLRFLRGVVDSQDLPLNISREGLQDNPVLFKIRDALTKKTLSELAKKLKKDKEGYLDFWNNFGAVIKEGLCEAISPKEKILETCLFASTESDELTTMDDYIARMKDDQKAIYYLAGDDLTVMKNSPQLEGFKKQGIEVLLFTDHVDDFWVNATPKIQELELKSVIRSGDDLDQPSDDKADEDKKDSPDVGKLCEALKSIYGDQVRDVRATSKLAESPVCLAVGEGDMDMRMERFLVDHKQLPQGMPKILEINPDHVIVSWMAGQLEGDAGNDAIADTAWMLLDQARIQEGETISDPASFAKRMNDALVKALGI